MANTRGEDRFESHKKTNPFTGETEWHIIDMASGLVIPDGVYHDSKKMLSIQHAKWLTERHHTESEAHKNHARNWW